MDDKIEQERFDAQRDLIQLIVEEWIRTGNLRAVVVKQATAYQVEPYGSPVIHYEETMKQE
jgi:hypothetical protein